MAKLLEEMSEPLSHTKPVPIKKLAQIPRSIMIVAVILVVSIALSILMHRLLAKNALPWLHQVSDNSLLTHSQLRIQSPTHGQLIPKDQVSIQGITALSSPKSYTYCIIITVQKTMDYFIYPLQCNEKILIGDVQLGGSTLGKGESYSLQIIATKSAILIPQKLPSQLTPQHYQQIIANSIISERIMIERL